MGQGTKVPGSELARVLLADSLPGANWPGSEKAVNRDYRVHELGQGLEVIVHAFYNNH